MVKRAQCTITDVSAQRPWSRPSLSNGKFISQTMIVTVSHKDSPSVHKLQP